MAEQRQGMAPWLVQPNEQGLQLDSGMIRKRDAQLLPDIGVPSRRGRNGQPDPSNQQRMDMMNVSLTNSTSTDQPHPKV